MAYFLAIIGGGPAGYTAAEMAAKAGKEVVLFERNAIGGTCLNVGCIPTKTLLYSAKQYYSALHADKYGVQAADVSFDYTKMVSGTFSIAAIFAPIRSSSVMCPSYQQLR